MKHTAPIRCLIALAIVCASSAAPQSLSTQDLQKLFTDQDTSIVWEGNTEIRSYDYWCDSLLVEAIAFKPAGQRKFPAILFIPGYGKTARDYISYVLKFSQEGFACIAITQPGFGKSQGESDYAGPYTLKALTAGFRKFQREPFVDAQRMGIYGYSRGGMAASLLAVELDDVRAAVLAAGIYDFARAYEETKFEGIRKNMASETGMTEEAIRQRSSILRMDKLSCPVLILHGEKDENVPVSQAYSLRSRLLALQKEFEIHLFPDRAHNLGREAFGYELDFLKRKL